MTDVGCGDFNIGRQICSLVSHYNALDVSTEIIERNRQNFSYLTNVDFIKADACTDELPTADLMLSRQVLQHLTNRQIELVCQNVERSNFKYALITEHIVKPKFMKAPNIDLPSHGPGTRVSHRSGVLLCDPPFLRPVHEIFQIGPAKDSTALRSDEILQGSLWKF